MTARELLKKEGVSVNDAVREVALLTALSKISRYEAECQAFEARYGVKLDELKARNSQVRESEDFNIEDDLIEWEFASSALQWLKKEVNSLGLDRV